ncbi:nucleotide exchange factor GrpE [Candidatus Kaiserbacteria bacterium RIFCSPHIGHO2_02_FULL_50_9]|uniref:Protein GrpE n=1 Tax=Candidatus Kaiserbacteria bacterium RIFCSPLOWO2_01_FULL_51_21 TaxID=1798508 RepID=A0A1F6EDN9_9BACT|nr:MAG: nucleotide exchange factor GrpE [Candidatus Kaiserbacteria bacterium RIFCSPHIGHO2_01_FULL_51_33]OGG63689.1 MAG: nucleotide exchange factor GrpE [Candidatus Kaiserbacteria bacterium RIFCSPHIGHO2_02_FULL_50_9]OGG71778.1 MAG: nucleotide exchange factor GrpE [Candidatus Kaiserbacteria bacterium RIFCSPLOWO2_01_FULL_51_21]
MSDSEEEFIPEEEEENPSLAVKKLRERLKKCIEEKQEYLDGWQRTKADFVNARREEEKRLAELLKFAEVALIMDILPVLDSFDMAMSDKAAWESVSKEWRSGMESIAAQLEGVLKEHGVGLFSPLGESFSPVEHEAIDTIETSEEDKDHKVAEVFQRGYRLQGKVIRPAKVKIFKSVS